MKTTEGEQGRAGRAVAVVVVVAGWLFRAVVDCENGSWFCDDQPRCSASVILSETLPKGEEATNWASEPRKRTASTALGAAGGLGGSVFTKTAL